MAPKILIWAVVASGLFMATWFAAGSYFSTTTVIPRRYARYGDIGVSTQEEYANRAVHLHDTFFGTRLGPFTIQIFPRKWASYLIIIGVAFILHVPQSHSGR